MGSFVIDFQHAQSLNTQSIIKYILAGLCLFSLALVPNELAARNSKSYGNKSAGRSGKSGYKKTRHGAAGKYSPGTASFAENASWSAQVLKEAEIAYNQLDLAAKGLTKKAFLYGWKGYRLLQKKGYLQRSDVLSICDFSQSSRRKRLYIINVEDMSLLVNTYVAHGRNSGGEFAQKFSNKPQSRQSSLGFYVTRETYIGEHGLSLRIDGIEKGFNDRANARNIVIHGSEYLGNDFLENNPFNGRSYGCPAVPDNESQEIIETIKNGSCLFIYHPTSKYLSKSRIINA
ncbi:murein L,D-transpeptidase catalytic domain family protein [Flavihumibacter profundi]|uniref:murein L,D-transpeptidase catalytic domain family protein n=1 Tax=Flavihumibacter profundi TaxID=2716883 RepID=UPI001CC5EF0F|nr:murein L,D-transpeptidase catalytic domain family protein [Flavihumibacter profundi]MBZ5857829.1 murein L,D-transpeptidase catalytic domain family protein [Flavihumibacter profundi]